MTEDYKTALKNQAACELWLYSEIISTLKTKSDINSCIDKIKNNIEFGDGCPTALIQAIEYLKTHDVETCINHFVSERTETGKTCMMCGY